MATGLRGPGRLPKPENLGKYSEERLLALLKRFGQRVDLPALRRSLRNTLRRYVGVPRVDKAMADHIRKQVKTRVRMWLIDQARRNISDYRYRQLRERGAGADTWLRWLSVTDSGTCKSCYNRHNRVEKMRTWNLIGRPGGRQIICQQRCRCRLIRARKPRGRE